MSGPVQKLFEERNSEVFHVEVGAATTLSPGNHRVHLRTEASEEFTVTLPPVAKCYGMYTFNLVELGASGVVTLQDQDDSHDWTDKTLDATADGIALWCDGYKWWVAANDIA